MNSSQYKRLVLDGDHKVEMIPLDKINRPSTQSQLRKSGTDSGHHARLKGSIENSGQKIPITVELEANGTYTLVAGEHRYTAGIELGWSDIKAVPMKFSSPLEKKLFQIEENEEDPKKNNCAATQEAALEDLINNLKYYGPSPTLEEVYELERERKTFPSLHHHTLTAMLKRFMLAIPLLCREENIRDTKKALRQF